MSRTDVHRPWPVQVADPYNRHRFYRFASWPDRMELVPVKNFACGCKMCTGQLGRKKARRQERTWWKNTRADLQAAAAARQVDALDVAPFHSSAW